MDRCKKSFGLPVASQTTLSLDMTNLGLWLREDNTKQIFIIKKMPFLFTCLTFVFAQKDCMNIQKMTVYYFFKRQKKACCLDLS